MQEIGSYDNYTFLSRAEEAHGDRTAHFSEEVGAISSLAAELARRDQDVLWSAPESLQGDHYLRDPRPRKLIVVDGASGGIRGAGFILHSECAQPKAELALPR